MKMFLRVLFTLEVLTLLASTIFMFRGLYFQSIFFLIVSCTERIAREIKERKNGLVR